MKGAFSDGTLTLNRNVGDLNIPFTTSIYNNIVIFSGYSNVLVSGPSKGYSWTLEQGDSENAEIVEWESNRIYHVKGDLNRSFCIIFPPEVSETYLTWYSPKNDMRLVDSWRFISNSSSPENMNGQTPNIGSSTDVHILGNMVYWTQAARLTEPIFSQYGSFECDIIDGLIQNMSFQVLSNPKVAYVSSNSTGANTCLFIVTSVV